MRLAPYWRTKITGVSRLGEEIKISAIWLVFHSAHGSLSTILANATFF